MSKSIVINMFRGLVNDVELPDEVEKYLLIDYDIEDHDAKDIPKEEYPDLVIVVKGGNVIDVINNTGFEHIIKEVG